MISKLNFRKEQKFMLTQSLCNTFTTYVLRFRAKTMSQKRKKYGSQMYLNDVKNKNKKN